MQTPLSLSQLETLYWIARLGSFHAAARHLRLTQPAISSRIVDLERTLGVRIFDRTRQRAELTGHGREILNSVEHVLRLTADIARRVKSRDPLHGVLRLGSLESISLQVLPQFVSQLITDNPNLRVEILRDVDAVLARKLKARKLDLAFLTDPEMADHITSEPIGHIELQWVAGSRLKLPRRELTPADLAPIRIFTTRKSSTSHTVITDWFRSAGLEPENLNICNSLSLIVDLIAAGHGAALLPPATLKAEIKSGRVRVLSTKPAIKPRIMYASYAGEPNSPSFKPIIQGALPFLKESGLLRPL